MIEILTSGLMNSVQDLGRPLYLDQGVGRGGAMDRQALTAANLLVGNEAGAAGLEIAVFPFRLRFSAPCLVAMTGAFANARLGDRSFPAWWAREAEAGGELRIDAPLSGARVMLAFSGGVNLPLVLGSRATDLKSGFGGLEGRALKRGDRLALGPSRIRAKQPAGHGLDSELLGRDDPALLRIMAGAEYADFADEALSVLLGSDFVVSRQSNRQGMRLEGELLTLTRRLELHSHGIMPGTVQVPPSGQAVIQLAEANTCGGYPKIAHVIGADHWKLAQARAGDRLRFRLVDRAEALAAERAPPGCLKQKSPISRRSR
ncbi:biotin-dependent carboxyltransferase family protein [Rhizobium sp. G21]|uniref:5-oxoprolinase subunit C family protein n=1 Tax=Rhizobium sp. G21 TaxID=2758439 RepID=UPI0015FEDEF2|nr:biotin-dependent carboxyltransferase family protein [Rhizobium sp. G21]MBB1249283.1 biotin-dependent carboxyltransferase [Rhizobium sp. G21]